MFGIVREVLTGS